MFASTESIPLLDAFRVPYQPCVDVAPPARLPLTAIAWAEAASRPRTLTWPRMDCLGRPARLRLGSATLLTPVLPDNLAGPLLDELGGDWRPVVPIVNRRGEREAAIWRDDGGNFFLPFSPVEATEGIITERYRLARGAGVALRMRGAAASAYYRVRPATPRRLQIAMRRLMRRAQTRVGFPAWPVETSLHDLYDLFFECLAELARRPVPYIAPWPEGYAWALVLTHDVETRMGYEALDRLRGVERDAGVRSSWNFVPGRYKVDDEVVADLQAEGHEVGVHGLLHDGRDLESWAVLSQRLPAIRQAAGRWGAVGFRSPALRRSLELMPRLGFDYDSSYPDTDPHGPDGGGCCSWLPYLIDDLVELPVTLPQDHTLFDILGRVDASAWLEKAAYLRSRGGMALLITHPDYLLADERLAVYGEFLDAFADDPTAWRALPREVSSWWRRRMASRVVPEGDGWRVIGPAAAAATVAFAEPRAARAGTRAPADAPPEATAIGPH
jgi:peptidoglycan/xylan/chitin deacetylase (PgdA/CDA1 family)